MPGVPDRHDLPGSELSEEDQPTLLEAVFQRQTIEDLVFTVLQFFIQLSCFEIIRSLWF